MSSLYLALLLDARVELPTLRILHHDEQIVLLHKALVIECDVGMVEL